MGWRMYKSAGWRGQIVRCLGEWVHVSVSDCLVGWMGRLMDGCMGETEDDVDGLGVSCMRGWDGFGWK
jgi:hypothetical protein